MGACLCVVPFLLEYTKDLRIILVKLEEFNIQRHVADERSKRHTGLQPMVGPY
jgi:hypothetical protein